MFLLNISIIPGLHAIVVSGEINFTKKRTGFNWLKIYIKPGKTWAFHFACPDRLLFQRIYRQENYRVAGFNFTRVHAYCTCNVALFSANAEIDVHLGHGKIHGVVVEKIYFRKQILIKKNIIRGKSITWYSQTMKADKMEVGHNRRTPWNLWVRRRGSFSSYNVKQRETHLFQLNVGLI